MKRDDAIFVLIGNKKDLASEKRQVTVEEGIAFAKERDFIFKEVSAKDGSNINDLFYVEILNKISKKFGLGESEEEVQPQQNGEEKGKGKIKISSLKESKNEKTKKRRCCK